MIIRKTSLADIDLLIELRIAYLLDQNTKDSLGDFESLADKLRMYFVKAITNGEFIAVIAEGENEVYSTAYLSLVERPPRTAESSYLVGTVYNVYTYPQYRNKGLATKVMTTLLQEAKLMNVASVDLLASNDGKPLYEKLGFHIPKHTYMRMKKD